MAASLRQPLPPCCHAVHPGLKDTTKARFKTELSKAAAPGRQDAFTRLAAALTESRSALRLDRSGYAGGAKGESASRFAAVEDIQAYTADVVAYLSLVKGFCTPLAAAAPADLPAVSFAAVDASTPASALRQPLIGDYSPLNEAALLGDSADSTAAGGASTYSTHLKFCVWKDVLTNAQLHALNARHEYAQALLASGVFMMNEAREKVDALLAGRLSELDETQLKLAYQLFLSAAGVFDACLEAIDVAPRAVGAARTDLSVAAEPEPAAAVHGDHDGVPDDDMMEKWRAEQLEADAASKTEPAGVAVAETTTTGGASPALKGDLAQIDRVPDLAHGRYPQLLSWVALAEAQELVILRGMSREFVDFALMAKLSMDIATRYRESAAFATQTLPCATSAQADKLRLYATFKASYYVAVSAYFQGAASMEREDAASCAQAIANFKKAKLLLQQVALRKQRYEDKAKQQKEARERLDTFRAIYVRSQQIVDRDLDIMTHRNDSVYYERIPEPEAPVEALSLVRATEFPAVDVHAMWREAEVATCLKPTADPAPPATAAAASRPTGAAAAASSINGSPPPRSSCCESCVIS